MWGGARLEVVKEDSHQTQLVGETNDHEKAVGVDGNAVRLILELLYQFQGHFLPVPDAYRSVYTCCGYQWLPQAHIHPYKVQDSLSSRYFVLMSIHMAECR